MKLSKYRIILDKTGFFVPQKRFLWVFWKSYRRLTFSYDGEYYSPKRFITLALAENFLKSAMKNDEEIMEERIRKIKVIKEF